MPCETDLRVRMVPSCGGTWATLLFCRSRVWIAGNCLKLSTSMETIWKNEGGREGGRVGRWVRKELERGGKG